MNKQLRILVFMALALPAAAQHSMLTSNYLFNLFAINPAYAGQKGALDATMFYRKQWAGFTGAPETFGAMGHMEIRPKNFGVGLQVVSDKIGLYNNTKLNAAFAYKLRFDKNNSLAFGLSPGFQRTVTDWNKLVTSQEGDGTFNQTFQPQSLFTSGAGLFFSNRKCFVGLSTPNIIGISEKDLGTEVNLIGGYVFKVSDALSIKPSLLLRGIQRSPQQFDLSVSAYIQKVVGVGLSYRNKESMIAFAEVLIKKQLKIGYAYDAGIGKLRRYNAGSHEIMISYFFGKTTNAPSPRFF